MMKDVVSLNVKSLLQDIYTVLVMHKDHALKNDRSASYEVPIVKDMSKLNKMKKSLTFLFKF